MLPHLDRLSLHSRQLQPLRPATGARRVIDDEEDSDDDDASDPEEKLAPYAEAGGQVGGGCWLNSTVFLLRFSTLWDEIIVPRAKENPCVFLVALAIDAFARREALSNECTYVQAARYAEAEEVVLKLEACGWYDTSLRAYTSVATPERIEALVNALRRATQLNPTPLVELVLKIFQANRPDDTDGHEWARVRLSGPRFSAEHMLPSITNSLGNALRYEERIARARMERERAPAGARAVSPLVTQLRDLHAELADTSSPDFAMRTTYRELVKQLLDTLDPNNDAAATAWGGRAGALADAFNAFERRVRPATLPQVRPGAPFPGMHKKTARRWGFEGPLVGVDDAVIASFVRVLLTLHRLDVGAAAGGAFGDGGFELAALVPLLRGLKLCVRRGKDDATAYSRSPFQDIPPRVSPCAPPTVAASVGEIVVVSLHPRRSFKGSTSTMDLSHLKRALAPGTAVVWDAFLGSWGGGSGHAFSLVWAPSAVQPMTPSELDAYVWRVERNDERWASMRVMDAPGLPAIRDVWALNLLTDPVQLADTNWMSRLLVTYRHEWLAELYPDTTDVGVRTAPRLQLLEGQLVGHVVRVADVGEQRRREELEAALEAARRQQAEEEAEEEEAAAFEQAAADARAAEAEAGVAWEAATAALEAAEARRAAPEVLSALRAALRARLSEYADARVGRVQAEAAVPERRATA